MAPHPRAPAPCLLRPPYLSIGQPDLNHILLFRKTRTLLRASSRCTKAASCSPLCHPNVLPVPAPRSSAFPPLLTPSSPVSCRVMCSGSHPSRLLKDLALAIVCPRSGSLTPPTLPVDSDSIFRGPRLHPLHHGDRDTHPLSLCLQRPPASASLSKPPCSSPQQSCLCLQPLPPLHALSTLNSASTPVTTGTSDPPHTCCLLLSLTALQPRHG